jgi:2-dehydropantoate 2-reductase
MPNRRAQPLEQEIKVLIVGSGAMACLFAARLLAAGVPIAMLGSWKEGVTAIRQFGVRMIDNDGALRNFPAPIYSDHSLLKDIPYAIVLVKSWQTERTAMQMAECLAYDGLLITLQNGIGNREHYERQLGADRVCAGVTTLGATQVKPGMVEPAGEGSIMLSQHPRLARLQKYLSQAQFQLEITEDTEALLWGKLVINAAINPLTALLRLPNGELLERPNARSLLQSTALEAAGVATCLGINLPYSDPVEAVEDTACRTAQNFSSMLQDVQRGTPTEIDAICGAITRAGETVGMPTPISRTLWQLILALHPQSDPSEIILEGNIQP